MDVLWQPDLFSSRGEVTVDAEFRTGRRTPLDARSWVEVFPLTLGPSMAFHPSAGDLMVMGDRCQDEWVHSVPKHRL